MLAAGAMRILNLRGNRPNYRSDENARPRPTTERPARSGNAVAGAQPILDPRAALAAACTRPPTTFRSLTCHCGRAPQVGRVLGLHCKREYVKSWNFVKELGPAQGLFETSPIAM